MQIGNYLPGFTPLTAKSPQQKVAEAAQFQSGKVVKFPNVTENTLYAQTVGDDQSVHIQMTENTTEENPVLWITVRYYDKEYDFTRNVNDIDPRNASYAEMCALASWENKIGNLPLFKGKLLLVAPLGMDIKDVMQKQNFVDRCGKHLASVRYDPGSSTAYKDLLALYQKIAADGNFSDDETKTSAASRKAMDQALRELMDALEERDFPGDDMAAYSAYRKLADDALMDLLKLV